VTVSSRSGERRWPGNLAAVVISLLVTLLALEGAVRWWENRRRENAGDRPLFYYKPPGDMGMMDAQYPLEKESGTYRIVGLGDSITFGLHVQYDDVFLKRLERMLNLNESSRKAEVINLAQPGLSTRHEVKDLLRALEYDPDLIILGYCLNDTEQKPHRPTEVVRGPGWQGQFDPGQLSGWNARLAEIWHTWGLVSTRLRNRKMKAEYIAYFHRLYGDDFPGWRDTREALKEMSRICRRRKIPLVVVIFPLIGLPLTERDYPFLEIHEKVAGVCRRLKLPYLDLLETFRGRPLERLQVIPGEDRHFSEISHRLAAEAIYLHLLQKGLIPADLAIGRTTDMRVIREFRPSYASP
jgi:hypothetical protein